MLLEGRVVSWASSRRRLGREQERERQRDRERETERDRDRERKEGPRRIQLGIMR